MELPRGTFREIKKGELVSSILGELERKNFSGICSISSGAVSGTLVLKSGKCILAKIQNKSGDGAWDELQKMSGQEVDAALSTLDEAQVELSLEFNKACRLVKAGRTVPTASLQTRKPAAAIPGEPAGNAEAPPQTPAVLKQAASPPVKPAPTLPARQRPPVPFTAPPAPEPVKQAASTPAQVTPATSGPARQRPPVPFAAPPAPEPVKQAASTPARVTPATPGPAAPVHSARHMPILRRQESPLPVEPPQPPQGPGNSEQDMDPFEAMDFENVTDKIRDDCKAMIKHLQLEHLMEQ